MVANTLSHLVQSLPQELYDGVFELVFTASTSPQVLIDRDYVRISQLQTLVGNNGTPPSPLQVNRATRKHFIDSCYSNYTFVIADEGASLLWASSLGHDRFDLICRFAVSEACASRIQRASPRTDLDMGKCQINTFRTIMMAFGRYLSQDLHIYLQHPYYRGELKFDKYVSGAKLTERWLRDESSDGMTFTKIQ